MKILKNIISALILRANAIVAITAIAMISVGVTLLFSVELALIVTGTILLVDINIDRFEKK